MKRIYTNKELKPLCEKSIFKNLLIVFSANNCLMKQVDEYQIGCPISVDFSDIYMCKMGEDVKRLKPKFYKGYVDDTYVKRKRNEPDILFHTLNPDRPNIKFTLEQNPKKFLDTQIIKDNDKIETHTFFKKSMYPAKMIFR